MSLSDITLNSKVYSVSSVAGRSVVRRVTAATTPANNDTILMEISHTPGSGTKPDRHLVKFSQNYYDTVLLKWFNWSAHLVLTVPQGPSSAARTAFFDETADLIAEDLLDFVATSGMLSRISNGEFS